MIRTNHEIMEEVAIIAKSKIILEVLDDGNITKLIEVKNELETLEKYGIISRGEFEKIVNEVEMFAYTYFSKYKEEV